MKRYTVVVTKTVRLMREVDADSDDAAKSDTLRYLENNNKHGYAIESVTEQRT